MAKFGSWSLEICLNGLVVQSRTGLMELLSCGDFKGTKGLFCRLYGHVCMTLHHAGLRRHCELCQHRSRACSALCPR
jgi:hypothetical protein